MSNLTLPGVRVYTANDIYHYTTDNRPLIDLMSRDDALLAAINALSSNANFVIAKGNWDTLIAQIDLTAYRGTKFGFIVKIWATQDTANLADTNSILHEEILLGNNASTGGLTLDKRARVFSQWAGAIQPTINVVVNGDGLNISVTGYTGPNGIINVKFEPYSMT